MARPSCSLITSALSPPYRPLSTCLFCQYQLLHAPRRLQSTSTATAKSSSSTPPPPIPHPQQIVTPQRPKRPHVRAFDGELVPAPLNRPLGLPHPPQPGQNSGIDTRSWKQKREDFASYDKHIERRQDLYVQANPRSVALSLLRVTAEREKLFRTPLTPPGIQNQKPLPKKLLPRHRQPRSYP